MQTETPLSLSAYLSNLVSHPLFQISGFALTVIFGILAYVFYRRSLRERRLLYAVFSNTLAEDLSSRLNELRITYQGRAQERVTVTTIFLWNEGREPIRASDIAPKDPLCIEIEEGADILSANIADTTNVACNPSLGGVCSSLHRVIVNFAFLSGNDGVTVSLVHNGKKDHPVKLRGTIIGGKIEQIALTWSNQHQKGGWYFFAVMVELCAIAVIVIMLALFLWWNNSALLFVGNWIPIILLPFLVGVLLIPKILRRLAYRWAPRVPERLWVFW